VPNVLLKRNCPEAGVAGRCPVVPAGRYAAPVDEFFSTPVLVIVIPPVEAETEIPEPAVAEVTPVLVTVTPPVEADTEIAVPAVSEVTPVLVIVGLPDTPSPFDTEMPVEAAIERVETVPAPVREIRPVVAKLARAWRSASYAWTFVPISTPRLVRAVAASEAPVPPLATARVPVIPVVSGRPVQLVRVPELGVPRAGVTSVGEDSVGELDNTTLPVPVEVVTPVPPLATGSVPVTPVVIGRPVQFVSVPEAGVPSTGVTSVGLVANTRAPEPVSSVTAALRLALEGVAKNVATPVPKPEMPVDTGRPVQLVNVPDVGVPRAGVTSVAEVIVGEVDRTTEPVPVEDVTPEPPLATGSTPDTWVVRSILPQLGATPTPPEIRALPVATSASLDSVVAPEA